MNSFEYFAPTSVAELCSLLDAAGGKILAGGTDLLPQMRHGRICPTRLLDVGQVAEMRSLRVSPELVCIGSCTTHADLLACHELQTVAAALYDAVSVIGCVQTRNRGTIGGNIANASRTGDTLPALLVLGASIALVSSNGQRQVPLTNFLVEPHKTAIYPGEAILQTSFKSLPRYWGSAFAKVSGRQAFAKSVASAAVALCLEKDGRIRAARIAFGGLVPIPLRCKDTETALVGRSPDDVRGGLASAIAADLRSAIDGRSSAAYCLHVAEVLLARTIRQASSRAMGGSQR